MVENETILVTGATGFVGGWLVETLHLDKSAKVRAGIKSWSSAARLGRFPIEVVPCDVMDEAQIAQAVDGVTCVIHCVTGSRDIIVQGTENMLQAAQRVGVARFVYLSTTEVYGHVNGEIDEKFPYRYTGSEYGDAKIQAEHLCWKYAQKGLPITIIRPSIVYGPFGRDWTVGIARKLQSGNWGMFKGYGEGICNLVYVRDLVSGILMAAHQERAIGEAFNLVSPETITWNQYFQRFNAALQLPELKTINPVDSKLGAAMMRPIRSGARFVRDHLGVPIQKVYEGFREARVVMQRLEKTIKTTSTSAELELYSRQARYLGSKAEEMLGHNPTVDVDTGLQMSVRWLEHLGLVL